MAKTIEQLQEESQILETARKGMRKEKLQNVGSNISKGYFKIQKGATNLLSAPGKPVNISTIQRAPQTILSKEQAMLNAMFNQKGQNWGNGEPVQINNALTSGGGLIKTGSGNTTRRLFLP